MNEHQRSLADLVQNFVYIVNLLSKQDVKHFSKIDILGFATIVFHIGLKHMTHNYIYIYYVYYIYIQYYLYIYNYNIYIYIY